MCAMQYGSGKDYPKSLATILTDEVIRQALSGCELLEGLNLNAGNSTVRELKRGRIIGTDIDGKPVCGLVISGSLDVYNVAADGHEICLSRLTQGSCFGIANLFDDASLKTVLKCCERSTVLFFSRQLLRDALAHDVRLANRFLRLYNKKVDFLLQRIEHLTMHSAGGKLCEYLLAQKDEGQGEMPGESQSSGRSSGLSGVQKSIQNVSQNENQVPHAQKSAQKPEAKTAAKSADACGFTLKVTKDRLARQLGISRASLYRELKRLVSLEAIRIDRRVIKILKPEVLISLASQER